MQVSFGYKYKYIIVSGAFWLLQYIPDLGQVGERERERGGGTNINANELGKSAISVPAHAGRALHKGDSRGGAKRQDEGGEMHVVVIDFATR